MALINNLISSLGSKDPNKKLLSNVNDGQTTSTMEGQGFSDSQYESMAQDFAFQANVKADKARDELRTEYDRVGNVRSDAVKIAQQHNLGFGGGGNAGGTGYATGYEFQNLPSWRDSSGNEAAPTTNNSFEGLTFKQPKGELLNESDIDSLTNPKMYGQGGGMSGAACNTYSCAIQREAGATIPKDFSYRRRVDGKMIHLKAGDPVPTLPSNEDMDNLYTQMGYEHVQLKSANKIHELGQGFDEKPGYVDFPMSDFGSGVMSGGDGTNITGKEALKRYTEGIREVDNIEGGDIYRSGFHPIFNKDGTMFSGTAHSMTAGEGFDDRPFYQNSGYMGSGISTKYTSNQDKGTYLRYIGNTKDLKKKANATSFIADATRRTLKIKPVDTSGKAKLKGNTTGLNKLLKRR